MFFIVYCIYRATKCINIIKNPIFVKYVDILNYIVFCTHTYVWVPNFVLWLSRCSTVYYIITWSLQLVTYDNQLLFLLLSAAAAAAAESCGLPYITGLLQYTTILLHVCVVMWVSSTANVVNCNCYALPEVLMNLKLACIIPCTSLHNN